MTERMTLTTPPRVRGYHEARYRFALKYAAGKSVLDISCGDGYGSVLLATSASRVTSVDPKAEIAHPLQEYLRCYAEELTFENAFDLVISFETIEHSISPRVFLFKLWQALKPRGEVLISFPNGWGQTQFHLHDTTRSTTALVEEWFELKAVFGQNRGFQVEPVPIAGNAQRDAWVENILVLGERRPIAPKVAVFEEIYREVERKQQELSNTIGWQIRQLLPRLRTRLKRTVRRFGKP